MAPYINKIDRDRFRFGMTSILSQIGRSCTPGDLNYIFTQLARSYVLSKGLNYSHLNDVIGVFESSKAEFQRRVVVPYEDTKLKENGDVYELDITSQV